MSSARMVHRAKSRFLITALAVLVFCTLTYLFHNSQNELDGVRKQVVTCTQQQESLSAQLQVIFEYKLRLEKSLQKEKAEHKETKDECTNKAQEEKLLHEKESYEAVNKYNALQQHFKLLQSSNKDLTEKSEKLQKLQLESADEIAKLENKMQSLLQELKQVQESKNKSIETMKVQYVDLQKQNEHLVKENNRLKSADGMTANRMEFVQMENELENTKNALEQCKAGDHPVPSKKSEQPEAVVDGPAASLSATANKLPLPKEEDIGVGVQITGSSTTPVINPEAVMDHDGPLKLAQKDMSGNKTSTPTISLSGNKPTPEDVAAPLMVPDQPMNLFLAQPLSDNAHQLAPPENVQHKPENALVGGRPKQSDLFVPAVEINGDRMSNENKLDNHVPQDLNGALEELEDPQRQDNEIPRPAKHHEYQGGDYDKEEDDEGEQMDYMVGGEPKHPPQRPQPPHRQIGGGGSVMVNPK